MNFKTLGMLGMAILCGLGAMYGTNKLLAKQQGSAVAEMQDVLVAARDVKVEEMIKQDMVKIVQMAKGSVPAGAFSSFKDVEDRWAQYATLEGEPLIDRKLAARGSPPGLIARIPKGMRAYAIDVTEQSGVSGFVLPDHRVDVVHLMERDSNGHVEAETVLQDILVLASGQTFNRPEDRSIQSRTVTLAVTPEQVDVLVAAKVNGALTLTLRGLNDHTQTPPKVREKPKEKQIIVTDEEPVVVAAKPPEPPPALALKPMGRFVAVYRGHDNLRRVRIDRASDADPEADPDGPAPAPPLGEDPAQAAPNPAPTGLR